jgi:hypothetical protein
MAKGPLRARADLVLTGFNMIIRVYDIRFTIYESETNRVNPKSQIANYKRCPIFSRFAFKYKQRSWCGLDFTRQRP